MFTILLLGFVFQSAPLASEGLQIGGVVSPQMTLETSILAGHWLRIKNGGSQTHSIEVKLEDAMGRSPTAARIWNVSPTQLAQSYTLPVSVSPDTRVVLSAP